MPMIYASWYISIQSRKRGLRSPLSPRSLTLRIVGSKAHVCGSPGIQATLAGRQAGIPDADEPLRSSLFNDIMNHSGSWLTFCPAHSSGHTGNTRLLVMQQGILVLSFIKRNLSSVLWHIPSSHLKSCFHFASISCSLFWPLSPVCKYAHTSYLPAQPSKHHLAHFPSFTSHASKPFSVHKAGALTSARQDLEVTHEASPLPGQVGSCQNRNFSSMVQPPIR